MSSKVLNSFELIGRLHFFSGWFTQYKTNHGKRAGNVRKMTPGKRVTLGDMANHIVKASRDSLGPAYQMRRLYVSYEFEDFRRDMMWHELLVDKRTIKSKWDLMCANGFVVRNGGRCYLNMDVLMDTIDASAEEFLASYRPFPVVGEREGDTHPEEVSA